MGTRRDCRSGLLQTSNFSRCTTSPWVKWQPLLRYLSRFKRRMTYRGFPPDDPLLAAVVNAENALHALSVEVHYLSCGDSVGASGSRNSVLKVVSKIADVKRWYGRHSGQEYDQAKQDSNQRRGD